MSTVLILEDEEYTLQFFETLIARHPLVDAVFTAATSQDAIWLTKAHFPNIALLDIELSPADAFNGLHTAKMIASISPGTKLVFVTGYGGYALDSFMVHPYDYVLKPIQKERLNEIITELSTQTKNYEPIYKKIAIKTSNGTVLLDPEQIFFIEKQGRLVNIHSQQGDFTTTCTLKDIETILPGQFLKTHEAYIVNFPKILTIKPTHSRGYQIFFENYNKTAWMSRGGFKQHKALFASDI